jgi:predicted NBD/HSP70 family sugar kinase
MTSSAGDQRFLRRLNASAVLAALREGGAQTLRGLAAATGLSRPTVEAALGELARDGWVAELEPAAGAPGRPARRYRFRAEAGAVVGVDIGAHRVRAAVADLDGTVLAGERVPVDAPAAPPERLAAAGAAIAGCLAAAGLGAADVRAAGVGTPGLVARDGRVTTSVLPGWSGLALRAAIGRQLPCPVVVENDANLAVLAERWRGAATAEEDVVYVLLEQGVGAGVLLGGRLHRGHHGAAGEIAFGDFLGGLAALRELGHDRIEAALRGEPRAGAEIAAAAPHVARHVTALVLAYDPALVVIGGGLSRASERFAGAVEATLAAACVAPPRLAISAMGGESVSLGAVRLALDAAGIPSAGR